MSRLQKDLLVFRLQYVPHAEVIGHLEYNGISHRGEMSVQMPALWGRQPENDLWLNGVFNPIFPPQFYSVLIRSYPPRTFQYSEEKTVSRRLQSSVLLLTERKQFRQAFWRHCVLPAEYLT
jgi:hypothetical protein